MLSLQHSLLCANTSMATQHALSVCFSSHDIALGTMHVHGAAPRLPASPPPILGVGAADGPGCRAQTMVLKATLEVRACSEYRAGFQRGQRQRKQINTALNELVVIKSSLL